jgi:imidazolonepropionase-like amidohydrolase
MRYLSSLPMILLLPGLLLAQPKPEPPLVLTHVTVIDATGAAPGPDMCMVVTAGRITALGKTGNVPVPEGARVVDATGKFLIPGLWDMHVHIVHPDYLKLFIANGVTGVRDMHAFYPPVIYQMRKNVREGKQLGPRIVAAGAIVDGPRPIWTGSLIASTAEEGRAAVRQRKKEGADFIKVYTKLPREAYQGIADEAHKQGLPFAGHVPEAVSAAEASDLGQKSMEHLYGILLACSTREEALRKELVDALEKADNKEIQNLLLRTQIQLVDSYSEEKARKLFARFVKNGTWQVPTLTVLRAMAYLDDKKFTSDPRLKYMPGFIRQGWTPNGGFRPKYTPEEMAAKKRLFRRSLELVKALRRAGVPFLAGTDVTNPFCFPGFTLHDELELLVEGGGFTPLEALQTATRNPARFFGTWKDQGTIEVGKVADLVLLDANPLDDVKNTRKIAGVIVGGKWLDRPALDKLLAEVEAANK